jgi:hypothetical protein
MHYVRIYNLIESNVINYLFLVLIFMLQTRINSGLDQQMTNQIQVFLVLCICDRAIDSIIAIGNSVPEKNHYSFIKLPVPKS